MKKLEEFKPGDKVCYQPEYWKEQGRFENGIVKEFLNKYNEIRVVYHCGEDWENYQNYTGALTPIKDLKRGWKSVN